MEFIKLTDASGYTYNKSILWKLGVRQELPGKVKPQLCSSDVLHCYESKEIALILNQGGYYPPRMFQILSGPIVVKDWGKIGTFWQEPIRELSLPSWYMDKDQFKKVLVQFSILCAISVIAVFETKYPNDNRPRKAIEAAQDYLNGSGNAARAAAYAAAYAAADTAAYAARADVARAARAAAYAAAAAVYAARAADAAAYAAYAAAYAARAINFPELAQKAVEMVETQNAGH